MNDVQGWVHSWPCIRPVLKFKFDQFFTVLFRVEARGGWLHLASQRRVLSAVNLGKMCVLLFARRGLGYRARGAVASIWLVWCACFVCQLDFCFRLRKLLNQSFMLIYFRILGSGHR